VRLRFSTPTPLEPQTSGSLIVERRRPAPPIEPSKPTPRLASVPESEPAQKARHYPRLPDGAVFNAVYDGAAMRWTGTLTIGELVIEASTGGVMTLLHVLNAKYRAKVASGEVPR
jgi:hypothetical protein